MYDEICFHVIVLAFNTLSAETFADKNSKTQIHEIFAFRVNKLS